MKRKLIIDCDPGIGDALAVALALLSPDVELAAVTAVGGCVPGRTATRNLLAVLASLDPSPRPRTGAAERTPAGEGLHFAGEEIDWQDLNGPDGLGDLDVPEVDLYDPRDSARVMVELVRDSPDRVTLLTLGPLTNVKLACELWGDFADALGELVVLGGAVERGGDVTAAAEFNMAADPLAARAVLRGRAAKTVVPLDVSRRVVMTPAQYDRLRTRLAGSDGGEAGHLLSRILPWSFRANHQCFGVEGLSLMEATALAAVVRPDLFEREEMAVDVETAGELTRGMTVFDRRGVRRWQTNCEVLRGVEEQGVLDWVVMTLTGRV